MKLHLDILPAPQRILWEELHHVPDYFVLYGGTALALRLGHRQSINFDLFAFRDIALNQLQNDLPFLESARVVQQQHNTLSVVVERNMAPVNVSFFGVPRLFGLNRSTPSPDNQLHIASLLDLAATKVSVVQVRAEAKDYIDLDAIFQMTDIGLATALSAACKLYGASFNPQITLKALSYFADGNLITLPTETQNRLATAAREVDLDNLPDIHSIRER